MRALVRALLVGLLVASATRAAAASPRLVLPDGTELALVSNLDDVPNGATVDIEVHEAEVTVQTLGKANTLSRDVISEVKRVDKKLGTRLRGIKTSLVLVQGAQEFYIRVVPGISLARYRKPRNVVATFAVVTVTSTEGVVRIPFVTALRAARGT